MTKNELIMKIQEIYEKLDDLDDVMNEYKSVIKVLRLLIDDIPEKAGEITDDEKEEEE